jgi:hypothetical protein
MNLNNDVVYRRLRLGPLHQLYPGRSRSLSRHHNRLHHSPPAGGQERRRSKDLPEKVAPATRFPQTRRNSATFRAVCFASSKISGSSFFAFPM